jgi:hypothetical protein
MFVFVYQNKVTKAIVRTSLPIRNADLYEYLYLEYGSND